MSDPATAICFANAWLRSQASGRNSVNVQLLYIDINDGNVIDGLLFSQIMYWHEENEKGQSRLKIEKDGYRWLAKRYNEWWEECRIDERAARDSIDRMVKRGLIIKTVYGFAGKPTVHIRLNYEVFGIRATGQMPNLSNDATRQMQAEQMTPHVNSNTEITSTETTIPFLTSAPERQNAQMPEADATPDVVISVSSKSEDLSPLIPPPPPSPVKSKAPQPSVPTTEQINAMATITTIGTVGLTVKANRSWVVKAVREIMAMEPDVGAERIAAFGRWWMSKDWRGQKGQHPQPNQVSRAWPEFIQFTKGQSTNGNTIQSTSTPTSDLDSSGNRRTGPTGFAPNGSGFYVNGVLRPDKAKASL